MRTDKILISAEGNSAFHPPKIHVSLSSVAASHVPLLPTPMGITAAFTSPQGCLDKL